MLDSELFKILVNDLDPLKVAFFGAIGVIFSLNGIAHYLQEHSRSIPVPGGVANVHGNQ
jgi:hypothetical protein